MALGANAVGGFLFWLGAARVTDVDTVGQATALFTALLFVNYLTSLGLPVALARYAADRSPRASAAFVIAAALSVASSVLAAVVAVFAAPHNMTGALASHGRLLSTSVVAACAAGTAVALLVEVRLLALRRGGWVLLRAAVVALGRLPLLALGPVQDDPFWLFAAAAAPIALSGFVGAGALIRTHGGRLRSALALPRTGAAVRYAAVNWIALLAAQGPQFALPILVAANVTPSENAAFYVAWSITLIAFLLPQTLGQVLLVEGGRDGDLLGQVRLTLCIGFAVMGTVVVLSLAGRGTVTAVYGDGYASAARALPALLLAGLPWALTSSLLARVRVERRAAATVAITTTFAAGVLVPAAVLVAGDGVDGATRAWLLGNLLAGAVAAALVYRPAPRGVLRLARQG